MNFDLTNTKNWNPLFKPGDLRDLQVPGQQIKTYQETDLLYSAPMRDNHVRMKEKSVEKYLVEEF